MIERYLHTSAQLRAVFLLLDMRHEPGANDEAMYHWILDQGFTPVLVLTKADKLSRNEQAKNLSLIRKSLGVRGDAVIIPFSAVTKAGRDEIWAFIQGKMDSPTEV